MTAVEGLNIINNIGENSSRERIVNMKGEITEPRELCHEKKMFLKGKKKIWSDHKHEIKKEMV